MNKKALTFILAVITLIAAFSCKKELLKSNNATSPLLETLAKDSNFVSMSVAATAGIKNTLLTSQIKSKTINSTSLTLPAKQILDSLAGPDASNPSYYIFNYVGGGWAIISADKRVQPILAYNDKGYFNTKDDTNPNLTSWLITTNKNMQLVKSHSELKVPTKVAKLWAYLLANKTASASNMATNDLKVNKEAPIDTCEDHIDIIGVDSLLRTCWDQVWPYNYYCPPDYNYLTNMPAGCVATAMAQIMRYWQHPTVSPFNSSVTYDYNSMPVNLPPPPNSSVVNYSLAQLMFDAGTSVDMQYSHDGSNPNFNIAGAFGLRSVFGYHADHYNISNDGFYFDVIANLNNHWPVILYGMPTNTDDAGHAWVCDGYQEYFFYTCDVDDLSQPPSVSAALIFHMNWGFNGARDGYYAYAGWDVLTGSGLEQFNSDREIDYNIYPIN